MKPVTDNLFLLVHVIEKDRDLLVSSTYDKLSYSIDLYDSGLIAAEIKHAEELAKRQGLLFVKFSINEETNFKSAADVLKYVRENKVKELETKLVEAIQVLS